MKTLRALRKSKRVATRVGSPAKQHSIREKNAVSPIEMLNLLWDVDRDFISGSGSHSDTFIGPNKIRREGLWDVGSEDIEGLEYEGIITLKKLIPKAPAASAA